MKVIDIVGQTIMINNEEDTLIRYVIAHDAPLYSNLNLRFQKIAHDLVRKNVMLISKKGLLKVNFPNDKDKRL